MRCVIHPKDLVGSGILPFTATLQKVDVLIDLILLQELMLAGGNRMIVNDVQI